MTAHDAEASCPDPHRDDPARLFQAFRAEHPDGDAGAFERWLEARGDGLPDDRVVRLVHDVLGRLEPSVVDGGSLFGPPGARDTRAAEVDSSFRPGQRIGRYVLGAFIGSGGMGQVWDAEDTELGRRVALKLLLPGRVDEAALARFAREARAGGRLQHPNLVTTFDHGRDGGLPWIAQELVPGAWTLKDFVDAHRSRDTLPRGYDRAVAELVAELADGLHAAHEVGVIHRDVKPANVLVGRDGTPRLTDFGLARVADESALSMSGDLAGTWAYMSPEQVRARRGGVDRRSDVFSLGALLYELLTLRRAFDGDSVQRTVEQILTADPVDPVRLRSGCPRDLSLICLKALEKAPDRRYRTAAELALDLRRHLADEPIAARPPSRVDRARRWARRHPAPSSAAAVGLAALGVVSALGVEQARTARANAVLAAERTEQARVAEENAARARRAEARARAEREDVLRLTAVQDLNDLLAEERRLWPVEPERSDALRAWIRRAEELVTQIPEHVATLESLRARALPRTEAERRAQREAHPEFGRLEALRAELAEAATDAEREDLAAEIAALDAEVDRRTHWTYAPADRYAAWWTSQLVALIQGLDTLRDRQLDPTAITAEGAWSVARRLAEAEALAEGFAPGGEYARRWAEALPAIRAAYPGLAIEPLVGLVPLGLDPDSGLWEFAHLLTGAPPERGADGRLVHDPHMGVVLVLIPGGDFWMGMQKDDPDGPNFEPEPYKITSWRPLRRVTLSPYLISKYEFTQAQWERLTGQTPSWFVEVDGVRWSLHPVNSISWMHAMQVLERVGLTLPSDAQWEHACRAGTETPFAFGHEDDVRSNINVADSTAVAAGEPWAEQDYWELHDDGWVHDAPVGSFPPNRFGLHEMHGNVLELCRDAVRNGPYGPEESAVDPVVPSDFSGGRITRGGSHRQPATPCKSYFRIPISAQGRGAASGFRPSMELADQPVWRLPGAPLERD